MSRISKLVQEAQKYKGQVFKQPKLFVPAGCIVPQTAKDMMAKQLYQAGVITKDDYEKMLGVVYDGEFSQEQEVFSDEEFSRFEDEFKMSELAEYYDDFRDDLEQKSVDSPSSGSGDDQSAEASPSVGDDVDSPRDDGA